MPSLVTLLHLINQSPNRLLAFSPATPSKATNFSSSLGLFLACKRRCGIQICNRPSLNQMQELTNGYLSFKHSSWYFFQSILQITCLFNFQNKQCFWNFKHFKVPSTHSSHQTPVQSWSQNYVTCIMAQVPPYYLACCR